LRERKINKIKKERIINSELNRERKRGREKLNRYRVWQFEEKKERKTNRDRDRERGRKEAQMDNTKRW
jgi:hypothetical protein